MKELIEKLELLATFFALAAREAERRGKLVDADIETMYAGSCTGEMMANDAAFKKLDKIITEVKKRCKIH